MQVKQRYCYMSVAVVLLCLLCYVGYKHVEYRRHSTGEVPFVPYDPGPYLFPSSNIYSR